MSELDAAILGILSRDQVFTPDDLRGARASVRDAVLADGWPPLAAVRGRASSSRCSTPAPTAPPTWARPPTSRARPALRRRRWPRRSPRRPLQDQRRHQRRRPRRGPPPASLVTSNVDAADDPPEDRAAPGRHAGNGVHFLSSDRPAPASPDDTDWLDIPGGTPARCNPVTAPAGCRGGPGGPVIDAATLAAWPRHRGSGRPCSRSCLACRPMLRSGITSTPPCPRTASG
ncbi:MAG: Ca2+-dependent phosphoinositide-specific phospholipase C [bacterium]